MGIYPREVKNKKDARGLPTYRPGTVYDVYFRYKDVNGKYRAYGKRGFLKKALARQHEAEMLLKLSLPKLHRYADATLEQYLEDWLQEYAYRYLAPNTYQGYKTNIQKHINSAIGHVLLRDLTAAHVDRLCATMLDENYADSTRRYTYRVLSVALEHAKKHGYISENPVRNSFAKFPDTRKIEQPYSISEVRTLLSFSSDPQMQFIIVLAALYGLRRGEVYGLQMQDIDLEDRTFTVSKQLAGVAERSRYGGLLAPLKSKSSVRTLPITDWTFPFFLRQVEEQMKHNNTDFLIVKEDGQPYSVSHTAEEFAAFLEQTQLRRIRFHDLRRSAATNMHELTGDYLTIGAILGHSLKGIISALNFPESIPEITSKYITLGDQRKKQMLEMYHQAVLG